MGCATLCYMARASRRTKSRPRRARPRRGLPGSPANDAARVGVRELRQNLSVYLDHVKEGATLTVTEHGRTVASLAPAARSEASTLERLVADGRATAPSRSLSALPSPRPATLPSSSDEALTEQRDERVR
jgi:prevent-host-death family protein